MGLDMYLHRRHYIGGMYDFKEVEGEINISIEGKRLPIDLKKLEYIEERVGYWRKANQIHHWFVINVQGGVDECRPFDVDIDQLKELLRLCKEVYSKIKFVKKDDFTEVIENADEIASLLPTSEGFFFGSTDYDQWYSADIWETIAILETVIKEDEEYRKLGFDPEYEYLASW